MTVVADNYAKVLIDMNFAAEDIETMRALLADENVAEVLGNPFINHKEKHAVIEKLFPAAVCNFIKVMSDNGDIALSGEMLQTYDALMLDRNDMVRATLKYVTKPDDAQVEQLKAMICKRYGKKDVELALEEDTSLVGGFILTVGDSVLDKSLRTAILKMQRHFAVR